MKNVTKNFGLIALFLVVMFYFLACDNNGNQNGTVPAGKITITGLPDNLYIRSCYAGVFSENGDFSGGWGGRPHNFVPESSINFIELMETVGNFYTVINGTGNGWNFTGTCRIRLDISTLDNVFHSSSGYLDDVQFISGQATISWVSFGFTLPPTDGVFTLTEAGEFNNKYAILVGAIDTNYAIYGFGDATSATALKGFKIENGEVAIPVWRINIPNEQFESYNGNDAILALIIIILDTEEFDQLHYAVNTTSYKTITYMTGYNPVTFSSGKATRTVSQGLAFGLD